MGRVEQSCTRRPRKSESRREQGRTALPATTGGRDKVKTRPRQSQESARHESCDTGQGSGTSASPIGRTRRGGLASSDIVRQANSRLLSQVVGAHGQTGLERTPTFRKIDICSFVSGCRMTTPGGPELHALF